MADSRLILIPVDLTEEEPIDWMGAHLKAAVSPLRRFVVEHPKAARRFLKRLGLPLQELQFEMLDEHSKTEDIERLAAWFQSPGDVGLLSEAGCPAIADPGALLVAEAHRQHIRVVPHVGPSSLLLALMASGFNGQQFKFHGYLPVAKAECQKIIATLERESRQSDQTQLFIETPYRSDTLLQTLLTVCTDNTRLCVASDLTLATESVRSMTIAEWKKTRHEIGRCPTVFLLYAR